MNESKQSGTGQSLKRIFLGILTLVVIIGGIALYGKYYYTIGNGYRTGLLQKFSHKGNLIKTYEGEMILTNVSGIQVVADATEKFYFRVNDKTLANQLDTIQGQMITVHYQQKNGVLFWQGDSPYLVDGVKRIP